MSIETEQVDTTPQDGGAAGTTAPPAALSAVRRHLLGRCEVVAEHWQRALAQAGAPAVAGVGPRDVRQHLVALTGQAMAALLDDPFDEGRARAIGGALVRQQKAAPEALGCALAVLSDQLLFGLSAPVAVSLRSRLAALLGAIAAGFMNEAQAMLGDEHEAVAAALLADRQQADETLRRQAASLGRAQEAVEAMETALQEREASLEVAQRVAHLGSFDVDFRTGVVHWSEGMYRVFGLTHGAVSPSLAAFVDAVHPDDRPVVARFVESARAGAVYPFEFRTAGRGGLVRTLAVQTDVNCHPVTGRGVYLFGTVIDVTERRVAEHALHEEVAERGRAEQALAANEERLRTLVTNAPVTLFAFDAQGRFTLAEGRGLTSFGLPSGQTVGRTVYELFRTAPQVVDDVRRALAGEAFAETREVAGNWFEIHYQPIGLDDGAVAEVIGVATDVSDRQRFEVALEGARDAALEASEAKSAFLANMSHEIRTPMNAILGMADLLAETPLTPEQREYIGLFRRSGDSLLTLIDDILDLSKVEAGQLTLEVTAFDPAVLAEDVAELLAPRAHAKDLELTCEVAADIPAQVRGDPQRLRQVLLNLVGNGVKFTERGEVGLRIECLAAVADTAAPGTVAPDAVSPGTQGAGDGAGRADVPGTARRVMLRFSVRDTGIGVAGDKLATIFDVFTQVDASTTRRFGGTGLGLTIVKRLVELMGGTVRAESTPDSGSQFICDVPFEVAEPAGDARPLFRPTSELRGRRLLVVDDNATSRLILRRMLEGQGATVDEATGGEAALAALRAARLAGMPYSQMLLDRRMPDLDGWEVVARAQREGADAAIATQAIVLLTSDRRADDAAQARALGVGSYVIKPVKRAALLDAIGAGGANALDGTPRGPAPGDAAAPTDRPAAPVRRLRLLLADDSSDNRRLMQLYLSRLPYMLEIADDGAAAVEAFQTGVFDLVLMDVHMPVMDGLEATRRIRAWEHQQGRTPTPIVALTASAMPEDLRRALAAGCDAHVAKPVKKATLLAAIVQYAAPPAAPVAHRLERVGAVRT